MGKHLLRVCEEQGSRLNKLRVQNDKLRNEDHIEYDIHKHTPFPAFCGSEGHNRPAPFRNAKASRKAEAVDQKMAAQAR